MSDWRNIDLDDLEGYEFQSLVAELLSRMGFVVEGSAVGPDGGKHLLAHSSAPVVGGKYVVQCKRLTGTVPEHAVRELYEVVRSEDAVKGILFTTSDFSLPSRRFAENKPLELIDGQSLRDLLRTHMPETAATSSESEWQVPAHFELLCEHLNKLLNPIWEEWDGLRNGPVHLQPQRVDSLGEPGGLFGADMHELAELIGTLGPALTTLVAVSSAGDTALAAERFAGPVMRVLQLRRSASAVVPPSGCEDLKSAWLAVLDEQLLKARKLHEDLERIRESPERAVDPEGLARVTMDFRSPTVDHLKQLLDQRRTAHFELLCEHLNKLLNPIWEEWDGLRNGPVHLQPQRVDSLGALGGLIGADMHELAEVIGTLAPVITKLVAATSADDTVPAAERFAGYVMRVLQLRRSASAVVPPSGCEDLKSAWLAVLDEQLLKARKFHEDLERIRESPERAVDPEGLVRVTMDFTSQAGDHLKQLIDQRTSMLPQRISGCAVVTACFGDEQAPEVVRLRRWRDEVLSRSRGGRFVTSVYAAMSPSIAWLFRRSPVLGALGRAVVRKVLGWRA